MLLFCLHMRSFKAKPRPHGGLGLLIAPLFLFLPLLLGGLRAIALFHAFTQEIFNLAVDGAELVVGPGCELIV